MLQYHSIWEESNIQSLSNSIEINNKIISQSLQFALHLIKLQLLSCEIVFKVLFPESLIIKSYFLLNSCNWAQWNGRTLETCFCFYLCVTHEGIPSIQAILIHLPAQVGQVFRLDVASVCWYAICPGLWFGYT